MITINQPFYSDSSLTDIQDVIESRSWVCGPTVAKLESLMCTLTDMQYAVAVANATVAIELTIQCLNPHKNAEIITPSFTYKSAITAIMRAGCRPVFADINDQYVIDVEDSKYMERLFTENTIAVMGTDMFGFPCDSLALRNLAHDHGVDYIEDASQAIGAKLLGNHVGSLSDVVVFSFYATKNVGCGEGGILLTNDRVIYERAIQLREANLLAIENTLGRTLMVGSNLRMSEITAPLAIDGITNLSNIVSARRRNASKLQKYLEIVHPHFAENRMSAWNTFPILSEDRDGLMNYLNKNGVQAKPYYDYLVNYDPAFVEFYGQQETPKALEVSKKILSLPVHQGLNDIHMRAIAEKVKAYEPAAR